MLVNRRRQIAGRHGTFRDFTTKSIRRPNHLTMPKISSGKNHGHHYRPMITPVRAPLGPNLGGSSEFSHSNHQDILQQSSLVQVLDQGGEQMIKHGQQGPQSIPDPTIRRNVISMGVPRARRPVIAEIDRHKTHPGLHQSTRQQRLPTPLMRPVPIQRPLRFTR